MARSQMPCIFKIYFGHVTEVRHHILDAELPLSPIHSGLRVFIEP